MSALESIEFLRYARQFPLISVEGQNKLKLARVLCVGAGGLGCPALQYLAASGVGCLAIIDGDKIELSNLPRQILFTEDELGWYKSEVIVKKLKALNPLLEVRSYTAFFDQRYHHLIEEYDLILDASDNYQTRYLLNQLCRQQQKPLVSASVYQYEAQLSVFNYQNGPCYQCLYPEPPLIETANCSQAGVLGVISGVAGVLQAAEALKIILGNGEILSGKLLCLDLLTMRFNQIQITKQDCANHPFVKSTSPYHKNPCSSNSVSPLELYQLLLEPTEVLQLIDVRQPYERELFHIGGVGVPLAQLSDSLEQFDKEHLTIIYCKAGVRSFQALNMMMAAGFKRVYHLEGGILNWQDAIEANSITP